MINTVLGNGSQGNRNETTGQSSIIRVKTYTIGILFLFFYFLSAILNTPVFSIIATGLFGLLALSMNLGRALQLLVFLAPSVSMVVITDNTPSIMGFIILLLLIKVLISGKLRIDKYIVFPSVLLILLGSIRVFSIGSLYDLSVYSKFIITIVLFLNVFPQQTKSFKSNSIDFFVYGTLINLLFSLAYFFSENYTYYRFSSIFGDANYTGVHILLSIILLIAKSTVAVTIVFARRKAKLVARNT